MKQKTNIVFRKAVFEKTLNGSGVRGLTQDGLVIFLHELSLCTNQNILVSMENPETAFDFYIKGYEYNRDVFSYFPESGNDNSVPGFERENIRYQKECLLKTPRSSSVVCFGTLVSFGETVIPKQYKKNIRSLNLSVDDKLDREELISFIERLKYERVDVVEGINEYALRGDVVDFFPSHLKNPLRVSFSYETVESICVFDPENQQPVGNLKRTTLKDVFVSQVVDNVDFTSYASPAVSLFCKVKDGTVSLVGFKKTENIDLGFSVFSYSKKERGKKDLINADFLKHFNFVFYVSKNRKVPSFLDGLPVGRVTGSIEFGFWSKRQKVLVLCENDFFDAYSQGSRWQPRKAKTEPGVAYKNISNLKNGDLVVHESFGIGLFCGPIEKVFEVGVREGVELEYKNNTRVFISMDQLSLIHPYIGSGKKPKLSTLGSKKWKNEVAKAKESAREVVYELFSLYSQKTKKRSFSYEKENDVDGALSSSFSFLETPDQKKAFQDVFSDMNGSIPMDRLVSGDVGFGKTEVAIRAMFKAFLSDRLSVLLCPTTILADQHFITCKERLAPFGVSVSLLSRFKSKKEQIQTLHLLKRGKIDVLVGTHRVLSKDVEFMNLGLLVVDEEHRFGVNHKEKIRSFKNNIDVLTLTATPIPRTLQHSLIGLKNLTTIKTPPISRKPIITFVKYFDWVLVFSYIQREISRKGQVYFLYNDIKSIPFVVKKIQKRFKNKVIVGASGKMDSKQLEETILAFFDGFIDVLVCTTIIESGLDVTNANTIIINNAQNFGLAQLYQIRGRVGRGKRQASCLLLIPPEKKLDQDSHNRLKTIEQNTNLGSGHVISQKDLEIRGAGSLFGYKQSGHISSVGFEMYCDLLKEEVKIKKGGKVNRQPVIVVNSKAEIPTTYIKKESFRVDYYYQISKARSKKQIDQIINNLEAGFGELPDETKVLINISLLRVLLGGTLIKKVEVFPDSASFYFKKPDLNFNLVDFFQRIKNFKHKSLLSYKYENNNDLGLEVNLKSTNLFPSLDLLFCFVKTLKSFL